MKGICNFIRKNYNKKRKWYPLEAHQDARSVAVKCNSKSFGSIDMLNVLTDINHYLAIRPFEKKRNEFYIEIPVFAPKDKLVYILLECIIYTLWNDYEYNLHFGIGKFEKNINTSGFYKSPLAEMAQGSADKKKFNSRFRFDCDDMHYRRVIKYDEDAENAPAKLLGDLRIFLKIFPISDEVKAGLACTISELADNALEHAKADCLIDVDIVEATYMKKPEDDTMYYVVNVVVLDFADLNLGQEIQVKINNNYFADSERYNIVKQAFNNHKKHFCRKYNENMFFNITSFQQDISGRKDETQSGGTGLAELIRVLEEYANEDYCYVLSGKDIIFFKKDVLNFNEDNWVGFNHTCDYVNEIPSDTVLAQSDTYLPGTGYNFMLIYRREKNEAESAQSYI